MAAPTPPGSEPAAGGDDPQAGSGRFVPPPPPPSSQSTALPRPVASAGRAAGRQLLRPRVRVAIVGVVALLVAWWWVDGSVGTILTILGVLMLLAAWFGPRLQGRFAIEWGETGTHVDFNAGLRPAPEPFQAPAREALNAPRSSSLAAVPTPQQPERDVIEGEAHTVEIDVDELKALIAAAEQADATRRGVA